MLGTIFLPDLEMPFSLLEDAEPSCVGGCLARWKIVFAAILLTEGLVFGQIVYLLKRRAQLNPALASPQNSKFNSLIHFGNALSAGVFTATGMLHILPETIELLSANRAHRPEEEEHDGRQVAEYDQDGHRNDHEGDLVSFPWAYFVVMMSFYAVFLLEKIVVPSFVAGSSCAMDEVQHSLEVGFVTNTDNVPTYGALPVAKNGLHEERGNFSGRWEHSEVHGFRSKEFVVGLFQILAISAHSLFESLALGISSQFSTVLAIFIATAAHRWLVAMAISFKMVKKLRYIPFVVLLALFSTMVPIGIGIGASLISLSTQVQGVLFGLSAGTFIYIGVFECMSDEFVAHEKWMVRKFLATLGGAGIIVIATGVLVAFEIG